MDIYAKGQNMKWLTILIVVMSVQVGFSWAGEADVVGVEIVKTSTETFKISVTVKHDDSGWEHYADKWDIVGPDKAILGTRTLYHPHVDEQPFTRSLTNVSVASTVQEFSVRAHCSVHGYGGKTMTVKVHH
jgi:hypothetical protein